MNALTIGQKKKKLKKLAKIHDMNEDKMKWVPFEEAAA